MELSIIWWILSVLLIIAGIAGIILPALPSIPLVFAGLLLAAWTTGFDPVGWGTLGILLALTLLAWAIDVLAAALGAKRLGASPRAFWGATIGALVGMFFGLVGLVLGPFIGAVAAELSVGRRWSEAGRAGVGTWIGLAVGTAAKLAIAFLMVGIFATRWWAGG